MNVWRSFSAGYAASNSAEYSSGDPAGGSRSTVAMCASSRRCTAGSARSATVCADSLRCATYRSRLKRQIMSQAVGKPADAETPAPKNHINWPGRIENRRTKRSEEHTSELQSLMRISYAVFCLKKKNKQKTRNETTQRLTHNT